VSAPVPSGLRFLPVILYLIFFFILDNESRMSSISVLDQDRWWCDSGWLASWLLIQSRASAQCVALQAPKRVISGYLPAEEPPSRSSSPYRVTFEHRFFYVCTARQRLMAQSFGRAFPSSISLVQFESLTPMLTVHRCYPLLPPLNCVALHQLASGVGQAIYNASSTSNA